MADFDRRDFLKLVGVSAGGAAATACTDPVQTLIPYVVQPEEITPGLPVFYASTCQECPAACGLHVRTREGRPIKLEGNPDHPVNQGALCARGQAGIYRTYAPDRFRGPMLRNAAGALEPTDWDTATQLLADKVKAARSGTRVLTGTTGPTLSALIDQWVAAVGAGGRTRYEPFAYEALTAASKAVFGIENRPYFDLSEADYILDFGSDFLEAGEAKVERGRQLAAARDILHHPEGGAHFVYIGPRQSQTAGSADQWLAARPGTEGALALSLAQVVAREKGGAGPLDTVLAGFGPDTVASRIGVSADAIRELGRALAHSHRPVALPPGVGLTSRSAVATNAAVLILNAVIGAVGETLTYTSVTAPAGAATSFADTASLVDAVKAGNVDVLLVHGSNPVYSLPGPLGFGDALAKVGFVVSTASAPDETTALAHLVLPDHTALESWGDAAPRAGVRSVVQPTIRPLWDSRAFGDTLLETARAAGADGAVPQGTFQNVVEAAWSDTDWRASLAQGGVFDDAASLPVQISAAGIAGLDFSLPELEGDGAFTLLAHPSPMLGDGSGANVPILQELPDPVTSIMWSSWAEISRSKAEELDVTVGDILAVTTAAGTIELPAYPRGGIRDDVVAVAIGQGHSVGATASRDGEVRGASVISILPAVTDEAGGRAWLSAKASVTRTGAVERIAQGQGSDNQRGRQLAELVPLAALAKTDDHGGDDGHGEEHGGGHDGPHEIHRPYDPTKDVGPGAEHRWGMNVDLDRCTGCAACVAACYVENNIPTVGEEGVQRSRQMSWLRIERYIGEGEATMIGGRHPGATRTSHAYTDSEELGEVDVRYAPMMCQHCGAAPCEPVCPVFATYHSTEGLNGMIYNRCIGTRYCSNNCPYKVRRFNWFDYAIETWPEPTRLMLNPDVTVRGQGVMEKCTYCVQRIEGARQLAKDEGRPIADGEVTPACVQTCPSQALTFGNLMDEKSQAVQSQKKNEARAYHAMHVLNTRPATTYLAKVGRGAEGSHS